jgi:hypothetical protein
MTLQKLPHDFSICQIENTSQIDFSADFVFVSKTDGEISLVCESGLTPASALAAEHGWKALRIAGILDFGMVGVIAKISGILAREGISVFVVSTYNTDYILLRAHDFEKGICLLRDEGYVVE